MCGVLPMWWWCVWLGLLSGISTLDAQLLTGGAGYALQFHGVEFVSVSRPCGSVNPFAVTSFTMETWFRLAGDKRVLALNPRTDPADGSLSKVRLMGLGWEAGYDLQYDYLQNQFLFQTQGGGFADGPGAPPSPNCWASQSITLPLEQLRGGWHHIAAVWDGLTYEKKLYLDGKVIFNTTCLQAELTITSRIFYVGGSYTMSGLSPKSNAPFYGTIDETRLWSVARTQQQIKDYMQRSIPSSDFPQMITYLRYDEGKGTTSLDIAHSDNEYLALSGSLGIGALAWAPKFVPSTAPIVTTSITQVQTIRTSAASQPPTLLNITYIDPITQQYTQLGSASSSATVTFRGISDLRYLSYMTCISATGVATPLSLNQTCAQLAMTNIPSVLPNTATTAIGTDPTTTATVLLDHLVTVGNSISSINQLRISLIPNVAPSVGSSGYALYCDGVNDYGYVDNFQWNTGNPVTVEVWALTYIEHVQGAVVFSVGNSEVVGQWCPDSPKKGEPTRCRGRFMVHVPWKDKKLGFHYGWTPGIRGTVQVDITPRLGQWTHYAMVSEGRNGIAANGTMRVYANGELIGQYPTDGPVGDEPLKGLLMCDWRYNGRLPHKGYIDDFRIWNRTLTQDEIKSRMYGYNDIGRGKPAPPGLVVAYDFDEDPILAAGYAEDISGNGYTLKFGACSTVETIPETGAHAGIPHCGPNVVSQAPDSFPIRVIDAALTPYVDNNFVWEQYIPSGKQQIRITLNGTDSNGDRMAAQLTTLPQKGILLYQNGQPISNEWIWQDPSSQRIDIYFNASQGAGGYPYAVFTYVLYDGLLTSTPATVRVNVPCDAGTYLDNTAKSCIPCPSGTYQPNVTFAESCILVPVGTYQPVAGQSSYLTCADQTFSDGTGAIICKSCQDYDYPAPYCTLSSNVQPKASQAIVIVSSILLAIVTIILLIVLWYRHSRVIFSSSTPFTSLSMIGGLGLLTSVILLISPQTSSLCSAKHWVFHLSMNLVILSLLSKTYRLDSIFNSSVLNSTRKTLGNQRLIGYITGYMLYDIIILAVWNGVDPMNINNMYERTCMSQNELIYQLLLFIPKILSIFCLIIEAYRVRNIPSIFNETRGLYVSMFTVLVISLIVLLMTLTGSLSYRNEKLVVSIGIMIGVSVFILSLMGPKFHQLQQEIKDGLSHSTGPSHAYGRKNSMDKNHSHQAMPTKHSHTGSGEILKPRLSITGVTNSFGMEAATAVMLHTASQDIRTAKEERQRKYRQLDVAITHAREKLDGLIQQAKSVANQIHVLEMEDHYQHAIKQNNKDGNSQHGETTITTQPGTVLDIGTSDVHDKSPQSPSVGAGKVSSTTNISQVELNLNPSSSPQQAASTIQHFESDNHVLLNAGQRSSICGDHGIGIGTPVQQLQQPQHETKATNHI